MHYYFSGIGTFRAELKAKMAQLCQYRLMSCHGNYVSDAHSWISLCGKENTIMLDSGAFSAWRSGKEVSLDHLIVTYADFIEKYEHKLKENIWLISLDKIPGSPGITAGQGEIDSAIAESDRNFEVLVKHFGNRVLPVFHQNESSYRLFEVAKMAEYICVSPRNDLPEGSRVKWASEVHSWLGGSNRTHGLATTGRKMMEAVPFHSGDSASWVFVGGYGGIFVYLAGRLFNVVLSDKSPTKKKMDLHFTTLPKAMQDGIVTRIEHQGFTLEQLVESHGLRMAMNMLEITEYTNNLKLQHVDQRGLFDL